MKSKNDLLHVLTGYFWAAINRGYNTSAWSQPTIDGTDACRFLQMFLTGNGIEAVISFKTCSGSGLKQLFKYADYDQTLDLGTRSYI